MLIPDLKFDVAFKDDLDPVVMAANADLEIVYWSDGVERLLGFSRDSVLGRLPFEVFMSAQDETLAAEYFSRLLNGRVQPEELWRPYTALTASGERIACDWYHQVVRDSDEGQVLAVLCLVVPADGVGRQDRFQVVIDQYAEHVRCWADRRQQSRENWNRLFSEYCSAAQFSEGSYATLTPRERELVQALVESLRLKLAARKLGISPNTARNHLKSVFTKLQVHSQEQLISKVRALSGVQRALD